MNKFWQWVRNTDESAESTERTLYIVGEICPGGTWFEDELTPDMFNTELNSGSGPVTVFIDSIGGDVCAAAQIYNALREYKGTVTVKIGSLAASAASVIAMSGDKVLMSPVGLMLIHNPSIIAAGDSAEMRKAAEMLDSVKESIINAYQLRTGLNRKRLAEMMNQEKVFDAKEALSLGFIDGMLFEKSTPSNGIAAIFNTLPDITTITKALQTDAPEETASAISIQSLSERLNLLTGGLSNV